MSTVRNGKCMILPLVRSVFVYQVERLCFFSQQDCSNTALSQDITL